MAPTKLQSHYATMKPTKSRSSANDSAPRYSPANPPYQINYRAKRAGKHISASKRRITFQFGFSSASAIASGKTEGECRGVEHEVVLVWSHMTGKRQLFMDGKEIHMSKAARGNTKFEYSWQIPGNHVMKIFANGTPPVEKNRVGARQFDLVLDGRSFFQFARIYELGGQSQSGRATRREQGYSYRGMGYDARDDGEELVDEPPVPEVKTSVDLFDFSAQPSISPVTAGGSYNGMPSLVGSSSSNSTSTSSFEVDEFTPVETVSQYQKSFDSTSNQILGLYGTQAAPAPSSSNQQSSSRALVPVSEENMDAITKSMRNLVNLDDITTGPLQPLQPKSTTLGGMKRDDAIKWGLVGRAPTLGEMRDQSSPVAQPSIMNQPPQQVYQQQAMCQQQGYQAQPQAMYQGQPGAPYQGAAPSYGYQYGAPQPPQYGYAPAY